MARRRKIMGAAAFSLALAGGGVAGALLGTPGTSGAQDDTTSSTTAAQTPATDSAKPEGRGPGGPGGPGGPARLEAAAEVIGISAEELRTELEAGKSVAQVAEEHSVDVDAVVDALVAEGLERLQELEDSLPERVTEMVNRAGLPERAPRGPHGDGERPAPPSDGETSSSADA